jgi:LPXTG-motif cell wall-anchored protein
MATLPLSSTGKNNFLLIIAGLLILVSIFLLWKYEEFKELSLIFVIQVVVGLILLRYYDD